MDFDFTGAVTSPRSSAPSTPKRFGDYLFSAPASPTRMSELYREFEEFSISINDGYGGSSGSSSSVPKEITAREDQEEFAFNFCVELERASLSAEELFDGGKIKPLEPPPESEKGGLKQGKKIIRKALSPKRTAVDGTSKRSPNERGRDRAPALSSSSRRAARSLSPLRVSQYPWEEEQQVQENNNNKQQQLADLATKESLSSSSSSKSSSRKWSLKDFLLFRSASEGRATDKDPFMRRYTVTPFNKKHDQDIKNANSGSASRRRGPVSAHELHYNRKRAAAEDSKRKTYLPYKQSILGRLSFSPAINAIANGFGSLTRA
ncbi:hypothetical protein FNV43_RR11875 [Rhamnella rubrinervis]|uniref:Uncharacterized protein n=1 Tax=Rhamnella rubrinervis TaxID=2594499 RepID=A0A8K0H6M6_9ROSA|nr:hypothetical protein FNV43_RR11875 [Rhamnella rubrinervis]